MTTRRPLPFLLACLLWLLAWAAPAHAADAPIPAFTPNVVDSAGALSQTDVGDINAALQLVRERADIWGAVYIVNSLEGEPIESLAERAFRAWALGQKGQDNGLLLVLAMQDRRSRLEVGYGLEGDLPDLVTKRTLDEVLAPAMRRGEVKAGIVQSFNWLASVKSRDPVFMQGAALPQGAMTTRSESRHSSTDAGESIENGWIAFGVYAAFLWGIAVFIPMIQRARARRLAASDPNYKIEQDASVSYGRPSVGLWLSKGGFVVLFLTVNPGVFIFIAGWQNWLVGGYLWAMIALGVAIAWMVYRWLVDRYVSYIAYTDWQGRQGARASSFGSSGSSSWSSSSDSSSSHSSSSGGGGSSGHW
jgi:uncharacterized protein